MDVTGERHRALLSPADLAAWRASTEPPVTLDFAGLTVCKTGPWGQGPVFLQQLALLDGLGVAEMDPAGPDFIHTVVESAKLAFADREAWYGDPRFADVPLARPAVRVLRHGPQVPGGSLGVPGPAAGRSRRRRAAAARVRDRGRCASRTGWPRRSRPRRSPGPRPARPGRSPARAPARTPRPTRGDTCHLDVADRFGNMVSATPSGGWLQSSPVIPGLGFCLGTRAQMFTLTPGLPNSLAPGKRPRTTLTPSLALRDGEPYLAFGTPGGDQQDQWTLAFFLRHVLFGMNLQEAIDAPAFHTRHFPSSFYPRESSPLAVDVEERAGPAVLDELRRRGHQVTVRPPWSLGRVSAVARDQGMLYAAANPRGMQGYAAGR